MISPLIVALQLAELIIVYGCKADSSLIDSEYTYTTELSFQFLDYCSKQNKDSL